MTPETLIPKDVARFWRKVNKQGQVPPHLPDLGPCWLWTDTPTKTGGYGDMGIGGARGRRIKAHRLSWQINVGPIPDGLYVLHKCDVPLCVNPAHLFLGTHADNMRDMAAKGRSIRGERHWSRTRPDRVARGERSGIRLHPERNPMRINPLCCALRKLEVADVLAMRAMRAEGMHYAVIASHFGVGAETARAAILGITWSWLQ